MKFEYSEAPIGNHAALPFGHSFGCQFGGQIACTKLYIGCPVKLIHNRQVRL